MKEEKAPGFNCPNCNFLIKITLKDLLSKSSQTCPSCQTNFRMGQPESKKAIEVLKELKTTTDTLKP